MGGGLQVINRFSICFLAANGKIIYNHNVALGVESQGSKRSDKVLAIINPKGYCTVTIIGLISLNFTQMVHLLLHVFTLGQWCISEAKIITS